MDFNSFNLNDFNRISENMKKAKETIEKTVVEGEAGGGFVKIKLNGAFQILDLQIDKDIVDKDRVGVLIDLIQSAYIDAYEKIKAQTSASFGLNDIQIPNVDLSQIDLSQIDMSKIDLSKIDMSKVMDMFKKDDDD